MSTGMSKKKLRQGAYPGLSKPAGPNRTRVSTEWQYKIGAKIIQRRQHGMHMWELAAELELTKVQLNRILNPNGVIGVGPELLCRAGESVGFDPKEILDSILTADLKDRKQQLKDKLSESW